MNFGTWIAIGNAILWSGVITFILFRLMRDAQDTEALLVHLEAQIGEDEDIL